MPRRGTRPWVTDWGLMMSATDVTRCDQLLALPAAGWCRVNGAGEEVGDRNDTWISVACCRCCKVRVDRRMLNLNYNCLMFAKKKYSG